jgi:hypothetical protein
MRKLAIVAMLALVLTAGTAMAQTAVTVDPGTMNFGYMNVFELDGTSFVFGSPWGVPDLTAIYSGPEVTLSPNTIGDPDAFWYQCVGGATPPLCGGPGAPGNKVMEGNLYAESIGGLTGQTVTFSGNVIANSLTGDHVVTAFIRDFAPDFSSVNESTQVLSATGAFSISLATINDPARPVQYGLQIKGVNVWITDTAPFGSMTIGPDQAVATEDATWGSIKSIYR